MDLTGFTERAWGAYRDLSAQDFPGGERTLCKEIFVPAGRQMSVQKHNLRTEIWVVGAGRGQMYLEGQVRDVAAGDVLVIPAGSVHCVRAAQDADLYFVELQCGAELREDDIERFDTPW